ncbi:MAG TPA: trigger factor [Patescibacteria group bacterium]|nr:trigger factor [Patescibacteria group bacterium]
MKTEVTKIDSTKRQISIEVSGDIVKEKFTQVYEKIGKDAKVPGFRPGHAPRDMLEKNYSEHAHEMVLRELIPDIYNQAVGKEGLDVIDLPDISEVKLDGNVLSFKATVEVTPEIKLGNYKGLKLDYKRIEVAPDELKRSVDSLKEARKADALDDSFAKSLGYPDTAELEKTMERQLFLQKEHAQRQKIEGQIVENLISGLDFKIPHSLVERQLQDLLRQAKMDMALKGMPREKIDEQEKELTAHLEPEAKKQVKIYLTLAEIAKKEHIPVDDHMPRKVMEFLLKEAKWE